MSTKKLFKLMQSELSYNESNKKAFHAEAKKVLRQVAKDMGLSASEFTISANKGGIAASGEIKLHTDKLYICVSGPVFTGKTEIMYRQCNGRKESTGGRNQWVCVSRLLNDDIIKRFTDIQNLATA